MLSFRFFVPGEHANAPSFRFSLRGNTRTYPRSGFVPGEHPPKPPFFKTIILRTPEVRIHTTRLTIVKSITSRQFHNMHSNNLIRHAYSAENRSPRGSAELTWGELLNLVWRILGDLPAILPVNFLPAILHEFFGLVSPGFQPPPPTPNKLTPIIQGRNCRHSNFTFLNQMFVNADFLLTAEINRLSFHWHSWFEPRISNH